MSRSNREECSYESTRRVLRRHMLGEEAILNGGIGRKDLETLWIRRGLSQMGQIYRAFHEARIRREIRERMAGNGT